MSYNHPYRNPPDDFSANNDKYKDSQRIHPRESNAYMSRIRNTSQEQTSLSSSEMSIFPPGKALSFLHSCGLDAEDLKTLAELPEHLITADALPDLLAEIKKKKMSSTSSSRSSALQASTSTRSWDDRCHTQSVEYPLDLPVRQSYSLNREQVPTWDDRWGDVQQTSSQTPYTNSEPNYVVEYNHLKDKKSYFDNASSYATEPPRQKTSVVSQSYANYSRDVGQSSHLSSRDISQSSHRSGRDVSQSSHLSSRDVSQSSHLSSRDVGLPSLLSSRDLNQSSQRSSRDISQSSHLSSRDVSQSSHLSSRDVGLPSLLSSRDVGPPSVFSSRGISSHSLMPRRDIVPPSNLSSRDIGPPSFLPSRDVGLPSLLSMRDLAPPSRLSSRDASQSSHQRKKPVIHIVPTRKEASDFHGKTPPVFPYACVLCEITVLSNKDWSVHVKGPQHANSQLSLVETYPEWDQTIQSARRIESRSESSKSRSTQERGGTSSSRNESSGSKSGSSSSKNLNKTQATTKAFVEMGTAGQAEDIVKYFLHNPLWIRGEMIQFSLSAAFSFLQSSLVVSFSPLPSGEGISSELMAIAKRFGSVKHSLFLPSRGYVEMGNVEEANKLVEYYSTNSLKLKGKTINVCFSAEYQSLSGVEKEKSPVPYSSRRRRNSSPKRRSRSSRRDSPSPKRRASEERSRSRRSHESKKREESRRSREKTKESSRRDSSSKSHSKRSSPSKDQKQKTTTEESVEEMVEQGNDQSDIMGDDSDLEGVAVIADDGEELNSEDELTVDDELDDEEYEIADSLTEQDTLEDVQTVKESNDETKPSDMDTSNVQSETSECVPTATTSDRSSDCKEAQDLQQGEQKEHQQGEQKAHQQGEQKAHQQGEQKAHQQGEQKELQQGEQKELQQGEQKELQQGEQKELQQGEQKELQQGEQKELQQGEQKELQQGEQKAHQQGEQKELQQGEQKELQQGEQKELQQGEQKKLQQGEQKEIKQGELQQEEQGELQQEEQKELQQGEQKDETVEMEEKATDLTGNLENLPTPDEEVLTEQGDKMEISALSTEEKYGKVLEVAGFPVAKKYSKTDLLKIGGKYGDVADCCLVRCNRKVEKALIEMVNAADAAKLEVESKRQRIRLGGKILRLTVSKTYSQVNEGKSVDSDSGRADGQEHVEEPSCLLTSIEESTVVMTETSEEAAETNTDAIMQTSSDEEEEYGRVLRIRNLPMSDEYSDADFLSIAEPYGNVKRHWMFRLHRTGLIEMENARDAEKVVSAANMNTITVAGKHPKVSVSTKHAHLNKRYFLHGPSDGSILTSTELEKELWSDNQDADSKEEKKQDSDVDGGNEIEAENSDSLSLAQTPNMDPVGTEFIRPVVGYFCSLCNAIYANEEEAKDNHCRTPLHHQKLKEHKERNSSS
ncbi:matrin 3-like 1.1 isoform X2 [Rhinichthys klamathensis goyatoka]|uniref:matrin 3-like 1.1 isoform X2 n=1 Tax=Rhinichthys klamathensis goyatoka TaxID=3034132 RepID=UPI0024B561C8|nr:matrin 3-like 1.1 isoform X2 [Rhinichthys klamathensis goyatoka]